MNIKLELLRSYVADFVASKIEDLVIDADVIVNTSAIAMISEIQCILKNTTINDFDAIEEIVGVFEKNGISCGERHDFG